MRMEEESNREVNLFWGSKLSDIPEHWYVFLAKDWEDYYFVKKLGWEFILKRVITLDDSDMSDKMREDYDAHDAWVDAVRDWETDESYESWSSDIDIWEECDPDNYHDCDSEAIEILANLWLWGDNYSSSYDWHYLDEDWTWTITAQNIDTIYNRFETNNKEFFNQELRDDIESTMWVHQIEFLAAEPIR